MYTLASKDFGTLFLVCENQDSIGQQSESKQPTYSKIPKKF